MGSRKEIWKRGYGVIELVRFFEDNNWFGKRPKMIDGKIILTAEQIDTFKTSVKGLFAKRDKEDYIEIMDRLIAKFPETAKQFVSFCELTKVSKESIFYIADFLLFNLKKDIFLMNDKEIAGLVRTATNDLIKSHGDSLTFFLSWLRSNHKTSFHNEYIMKNRYTMETSNGAYDFDEYLELLYYLFNEEYIRDNEMYLEAAKSKNYSDTWLFLAMHFICSLRMTDLQRIGHPRLAKAPEVILKEVEQDEFSDAEARSVLLSITTRLALLPLTPSKTSSFQNVNQIKFTVPESCEVHIGKLLAICEAHRQIEGLPDDEPLIRRISDYDRISRYMGDDIGSLFLESDFHSRSANKSYLQSVYMLADDVLEESNGPKVKGYMLAALARSHKGSYGKFAKTTATYLKDAQFSGLSPEFVAKELFERGVLSFIPSMLLKIITRGEYDDLSASEQTLLIKKLDMTPKEVENVVSLVVKSKNESKEIVKELINTDVNEEDILMILHRIGSGQAFSKQADSLCLLSACNKICPFVERTHCVGCPYEIKTKSTMLLLTSEHKRLRNLYEKADNPLEKEKYRQLLIQTIIPCLDEVLTCLKNKYGNNVFEAYEQIIRESINE
jgi:hypothetical protein